MRVAAATGREQVTHNALKGMALVGGCPCLADPVPCTIHLVAAAAPRAEPQPHLTRSQNITALLENADIAYVLRVVLEAHIRTARPVSQPLVCELVVSANGRESYVRTRSPCVSFCWLSKWHVLTRSDGAAAVEPEFAEVRM